MFKRKDKTIVDENGQPTNMLFAHSRLVDRNIDELVGICKGVLFDGAVSQGEAEMMLNWLETNRHAANRWPANVLYERLSVALEDGVLDAEEERDLLETLVNVTGNPEHNIEKHSASTTLPIDDPLPEIIHEERIFCITGKLVTGTRATAVEKIELLGGQFKSSPTRMTDYLIIGEIGSRDWIHSTFGRKIEKALELREKGSAIAIISEQHWASSL